MCYGCKQEKVILPLCCECPDLDEMLVWACPKEEVKQSKRPTNQPVKLLDAAPKLESGLGGKWIRIWQETKLPQPTEDNHLSACKESPQQRSVGGKVDTIWVWVGDREIVIQQDHLQVSQVPAQKGPGVLGLGSVGISLVSLHKVSWVAHLSTGGNPHSEEPDYQSLTSNVFISQSGNFNSCHRMPLLKHWLHFSDQILSPSLLQPVLLLDHTSRLLTGFPSWQGLGGRRVNIDHSKYIF